MTVTQLSLIAHAKINLALHVTDQRDDGFHILDSLVCFAQIGDEISLKPKPTTDRQSSLIDLNISGLFAGDLGETNDNLIYRASHALANELQSDGIICPPIEIALAKNLPVASGIGGGSADAAAVLNLLQQFWMPDANKMTAKPDLAKIALALGADVPMCLDTDPKRVRGIGEQITVMPTMPSLEMILVNPARSVPTPQIFKNLIQKQNPPLKHPTPADLASASNFTSYLSKCTNDLQPVAASIVPDIALVLQEITVQHGCQLARMSGSGATCFGIFDNPQTAQKAVANIRQTRPHWWAVATQTFSGNAVRQQ